MLLAPQGDYTVTDNYSLNQYAEIGLARGTRPLPQPTDVGASRRRRRPGRRPTTPPARHPRRRLVAELPERPANEHRRCRTSPSTTRSGSAPRPLHADRSSSTTATTRGSSSRAASSPPTTPTVQPRPSPTPARPRRSRRRRRPQGRELQRAQLLHRHRRRLRRRRRPCTLLQRPRRQPDHGQQLHRDRPARCRRRREPRRASRPRSSRAINALGADVSSLEEIENSAALGEPTATTRSPRSSTRSTPTPAPTVWACVPSPAGRPPAARRARTSSAPPSSTSRPKVEPVGASQILTDSAAFANAREPLAQAFRRWAARRQRSSRS